MQCCGCSAFRCRKCEAVGDNWFLEEGGWQTCKILTMQFPPAVFCLDSTLYRIGFYRLKIYTHAHKNTQILPSSLIIVWLAPVTYSIHRGGFLQIKLVLFFSEKSLKHKWKLLTSIRMGKKWCRDKTGPVKLKSKKYIFIYIYYYYI